MKKRWIAGLLCVAMAFGLVACGNEKNGNLQAENKTEIPTEQVEDTNNRKNITNDTTKDTEAAGDSKKEKEQELAEVTFVLDWTPNTNHTGVYVAQAKGYFEEAGLAIKIIQPPEDGATLLVAGGGAQFGVDFQDSLTPVFATDTPMPVTAVAAIIQHNTSGLISLKENGIATPREMEGFTYATWDLPIEQAIMQYVMEKDGGDFAKLNMVPSTVADVVSALQTNVDLVWIYYAWDGVATQVQGLETNYINFADLDTVLDYYSPVIIANNDYLEQNPEQATAFLQAVKKGYQFAMENPEEAAEILCAAAPELEKEIILESQKWLAGKYQEDAESWGVIDGERWDGFYRWLFERGVIAVEIPAGFGYSNDYMQ